MKSSQWNKILQKNVLQLNSVLYDCITLKEKSGPGLSFKSQ